MTRGCDNDSITQQCLLDLRLAEGAGIAAARTLDWSKSHIPVFLGGPPTWTALPSGAMTLDFNPTIPDYLISSAAATGALDFTAGDFSGAAWINTDDAGNRYVFCKSDGVTGWFLYLDASRAMRLATCQAGPAVQYTISGVLALNAWYLAGFSRAGAAVTMYLNGVPATATAATHVDPASAAALNFYVGCNNLVVAGWWDGTIGRPRIWGRELGADEHWALFERERHLYGV